MATNNLATAFPNSFAQATPRQQFMGLLADSLKWPLSPKRTQQMQGAAEFFGIPALQRTADEISYGGALGTGKGMTWQPKSDTVESALMLAPNAFIAKRLAGRAAKTLAPTANEMARVAIERRLVNIGGIQPAIVWHGSPHKFPPTKNNPLGEFDSSKIGTGEGVQAYGHGIYTADAPGVAQEYRRALSTPSGPQNDVVNSYLKDAGGDRVKAVKDLKEYTGYDTKGPFALDASRKAHLDELINLMENPPGFIYKVGLPDEHIAKMLNWDKPLSQQAPGVRAALRKALPPGYVNGKFIDPYSSQRTGSGLMDDLKLLANKGAPGMRTPEDAMKAQGIPGIRYLDQDSRAGGAGTSNYVVFPGGEDFLKILQRNEQTAAK